MEMLCEAEMGRRNIHFGRFRGGKIARPGDEVLVAPGVYREYVDPANAGCEDARIVYRSVEPGKAVITGAEIVDNWEHLEGDVWTARVSNGLFGDYNPYTTLVSGDWFIASYTAHTGEVYLNGKSMYEVTSLDQVKSRRSIKILGSGIHGLHLVCGAGRREE